MLTKSIRIKVNAKTEITIDDFKFCFTPVNRLESSTQISLNENLLDIKALRAGSKQLELLYKNWMYFQTANQLFIEAPRQGELFQECELMLDMVFMPSQILVKWNNLLILLQKTEGNKIELLSTTKKFDKKTLSQIKTLAEIIFNNLQHSLSF